MDSSGSLIPCPACGLKQQAVSRCYSCGAPLPRQEDLQPSTGAGALNPYAAPSAGEAVDAPSDRSEVILASRGSRFLAHLLDNLIYVAVALPGLIIFFTAREERRGNDLPIFAIVLLLAGFLGLTIYQWYLLARDGQTLGKKAMKVRIIRYDNHEYPGFGRAVGLRVIANGLIAAVPYLGGIYGLVDALFIFGAEQRCIHDLIAGTIVVEAE